MNCHFCNGTLIFKSNFKYANFCKSCFLQKCKTEDCKYFKSDTDYCYYCEYKRENKIVSNNVNNLEIDLKNMDIT